MIQIIAGALLSIPGAGGIFLGAMFLIASAGISSRLYAGVFLLTAGAALLAAGIVLLRRGFRSRPGSARASILRAAAKQNGVITAEILYAETGRSEAVEFELASMLRSGEASVKTDRDEKIYSFPALQFKLKFKKCPYCGSDYPVRENIENCPSCGGDLKIVSEKSPQGDDKFSMDI